MRKSGCILIVLIILLMPILLIFAPQIVNDIACMIYRTEVEAEFRADERIEVVRIEHACGNTSGTGDHTELWVGILIKTEHSYEELVFEAKALGASDISEVNELETSQDLFEISELESTDGYYILEFIKPAPLSWLDLRGA